MTKSRFLGAAILLTLIASPASAQAVFDEPGLNAFYHPNGDLGYGPPRPQADAMAMAPRLIMRHPLHARHAEVAG
jgi:hypothetical protein